MVRRAWGEGSYDYRETSEQWRWRGYYTTPNGVKKRKQIVSKSRKILKTKVKKFMEGVENSNTDVNSSITIKKWCHLWLNDIVKIGNKPNTYRNYRRTTKNHIIPGFGNAKLKDLQAINVQQWLNKLCESHAASTVITIRSHFINMLNMAIEYGYLKTNVVKRTKPPRNVKKKIIPLTDEEAQKLIDVAAEGSYIYYGVSQTWHEDDGMIYLRKAYYVVVLLALTTGMREGEIFGLKWQDVNLDKKIIYVTTNMVTIGGKESLDTPKTPTSIRTVPLPKKILNALKQWKQYQEEYSQKWKGVYKNKNHLIFTNSYGKMVSITNFMKRYFYKMIGAAGISDKITFHTLRHTHATQLLKSGVNVKVVSERLGHSATSVTMDIYAHVLPDMQNTAVNVLDHLYPEDLNKKE